MSQKILITGANGGFGKLTVHSLLEKGHTVTATMRYIEGRNREHADEFRNAGAHVVEMDVTIDENVEKGVALAVEYMNGLDVVINNAGTGVLGMQEQFTIEDWKNLFDINVFGVQRVNRAAIPVLRKQGSGLIIFVSSLLGRITLPFYGPYNSSKWALEAMAENYRMELSDFNIECAIVEPGGFPTTFMTNLMRPSDESILGDYEKQLATMKTMGEKFGEVLQNSPQQNPQIVADAMTSLVEMEHGNRPFRTEVDEIGMKTHIVEYNRALEQIMQGTLGHFGAGHLMTVKK